MNETLQTQIEEIGNLSNEELRDLLSADNWEIEEWALHNGRIETAKEAILIINELLKENKRLNNELVFCKLMSF